MMMNDLSVGDWVKVVNVGYNYSAYVKWSGLMGYEDQFGRGERPVSRVIYEVLRIKQHDSMPCDWLALIRNPHTNEVFIVGIEGLEKAEGRRK